MTRADYTSKLLEVAIEPGVATAAQRAALNNVIKYGATRGIPVKITYVP